MAKPAFKHGQKLCIFCGSSANSGEHVWPKWSHDLMPKFPRHIQLTFDAPVTKAIMSRTAERHRQGSVAKVSIKRVCRTCNSGWMSSYEVKIKSIFGSMMTGSHVALKPADQTLLAEYLVFKIMVLDWTNSEPIFTPEERSAFYANRTIPAGIQLVMAFCDDIMVHSYYQTQFAEASMKSQIANHVGGKNVKTFAIGFGGVFIFALCIKGEVDLSLDAVPGFIQLIPTKLPVINWPPFIIINRAVAEAVAGSLKSLKRHAKVKLFENLDAALKAGHG